MATPAVGNSPSMSQLDAFLAAERQNESGGNYTATNPSGGASGAYQFIQSTWSSEATSAGLGAYANEPASSAPPNVQDEVAAYMANNYYKEFGNWKDTAEAWYYPAWAGDPSHQNSVPYPSAGNTLTIGQYGDNVVASMNKILQNGGFTTVSVPSGSVQGGSSSSSSSGGGFLHSFDKLLNPGGSLNPFSDVGNAISMVVVRGSLALIGVLMVGAGLLMVGLLELENHPEMAKVAEAAAL